MPHFICTTCGTQHAESQQPHAACTICEDSRLYVKATGQQWTTLDRLRLTHRTSIKFKEPGLIGIGIDPPFAIGQRALFLRSPGGNILWDCLPLLDQAVVECLKALGGVSAIAISHPHYYSSMVEWSRAFGGVPIYLHANDHQWVMRPDKDIIFWQGETNSLGDGLTLIRCGGHFDGGTVLHWATGAEGKGALLSGDIIQVVADRKHVSFMYSYPNYIPLAASAIERIVQVVEPFPFERIYGAFWDMVIEQDGQRVVRKSAERYLQAIGKQTHAELEEVGMKTTVQRGTSLDYLTVYPDDFVAGRSFPLIIVLHGFGANMHDLADLAPLLSSTRYLYVFPNGPLAAVDEPNTRAWYERGGNESQTAVREALEALDGLVKEVTARYNVGGGRALLLGFSQGGAMALRYGLPRPDLFAGIAVLSGSLRRVQDLMADLPGDRKQPIFVAHGRFDSMVPVEWSQALVQFLEGQGYRTDYKVYSIDHEVSPAEVRDLRDWVEGVLPLSSPGA